MKSAKIYLNTFLQSINPFLDYLFLCIASRVYKRLVVVDGGQRPPCDASPSDMHLPLARDHL